MKTSSKSNQWTNVESETMKANKYRARLTNRRTDLIEAKLHTQRDESSVTTALFNSPNNSDRHATTTNFTSQVTKTYTGRKEKKSGNN